MLGARGRANSIAVWDAIFARDGLTWERPDRKILCLRQELTRRNLTRVYDLGCGSGRHTAHLAELGLAVAASDTSRIALQRTKSKLGERGLAAALVAADMGKQPFTDACFDAVLAFGVLFHNNWQNIQESIREIRRLLRPEGLLLATFQSTADWKFGRGREVEEGTFLLDEPDHAERGELHHFFTRESAAELLRGFRIIELDHRVHKDAFYHPDENLTYAAWVVLAEKQGPNHMPTFPAPSTGQASNSSQSPLLAQLLDAGSAWDFFEANRVQLHLSEYMILGCQVSPIRVSKTGGKSVIEYALQLEDNEGQLVSKSIVVKFRPDGRGQEVFQLLQELWRKGFSSEGDLRICEPFAYFPRWNLMVTAKASGMELGHVLIASDERLVPAITQAAKWLAKAHRTRVTCARSYAIAEEQETLEQWFQHLRLLHPVSTERLYRLTQHLGRAQRGLSPSCYAFTHGDYHPYNVFVDATGLTVIDLEQSRIFDPARDLGYFVAQLTMKKQRYKLGLDLIALRETFLRAYAEEGPRTPLARVAVYEARAYLQHLHFKYWTLRNKGDPVDFEHWMTRAEDCLQIGL